MNLPSHSVHEIWKFFVQGHSKYANTRIPPHFYFCDNEQDANICAELVVKNIKQATATSVWWYKHHNQSMPKVGDLFIVTDWNGTAKAIIEITKIELVRFKDVTEAFAQAEGEGDKSLNFWRKVHQEYYSREMEKAGEYFNENMLISCEYFKTVFKAE